MILPELAEKTVLVTGANHGIGAATVRAFADQGAHIFLTYFRDNTHFSDEELAAAVESEVGGDALYRAKQQQTPEPIINIIRAEGGTIAAWEGDLGNPDNIPTLFDRCEKTIGPVDILVNNHTACILETFDPARTREDGSEIKLISPKGIDTHFAVNSRAFALLMHEYTQRYLARNATWGRIINISTDAAHAHVANVSYAASKHAIESYSRSAAAELGHYGITVNIVAPGPIQTGYITPQDEEAIVKGTPLGRIGRPDDVANVILFLASNAARWVTGQLIYVGGGWRMGM